MARDKNHRPCLPLKPQEKGISGTTTYNYIIVDSITNLQLVRKSLRTLV
jgi:hypothetical protein